MASRINSPFSLQLPETPQTKNKEVYGDLAAIYNALQTLQQAMTDYGGIVTQPTDLWNQLQPTDSLFPQNANRFYVQTSEILTVGAFISIFNNAGAVNVRNANATNNTRPAHGYCPAGAANPADYCEVILFHGLCISIGGLTIGQRYFLSTVDGLITAVAPVAAGNIEQPVAIAIAASTLYVTIGLDFIQH